MKEGGRVLDVAGVNSTLAEPLSPFWGELVMLRMQSISLKRLS